MYDANQLLKIASKYEESCLQGLIQLSDKLIDSDIVVCIFHDHGSRYVGKVYNDEWMQSKGFL